MMFCLSLLTAFSLHFIASRMNAVGLTGGISTGKSTMSRWLSEKRVSVIDADVISRLVRAFDFYPLRL